MSCVTIGGQEVSARSILQHSKRRLIGSLFAKSKQSPRDHNRRLLRQNRPIAAGAPHQTAFLFDHLVGAAEQIPGAVLDLPFVLPGNTE